MEARFMVQLCRREKLGEGARERESLDLVKTDARGILPRQEALLGEA